ncbi:MAG: hypothetical protein ACP5JG_03460 [Anaerolineae bacterium]
MDQLRAWYTSYELDLARVDRFWRGEGRVIVSLYPTNAAYRQSFDDARVLSQAPRFLKSQAALPGVNLPSFYPDWGTISTAKYWGGKPRFDSTGGNIFVDPVARTVDEALALDPLPLDDPTMDARHALELWRARSDRLATDALWLRSPDMQGPLNTAGLVMNQEEMWMAMYTEPQKVHAYLDRVTDFLIAYAQHLRQETSHRICGNIWPYTFFPDELGISLTEDMMPLMSADLYKTFGIPTLRKLQAALGALHIHCCGAWGHHAENLARADLDIKAVEFHYPFTKIEELLCLAPDTVFIPYIMLEQQETFKSVFEYYHHLLATTDPSVRFWFACTDDSAEARAFVASVAAMENDENE